MPDGYMRVPRGGITQVPPEWSDPGPALMKLVGAIGQIFNPEGIELERQAEMLRTNPELGAYIAESQRRMYEEGVSEEEAAENLSLFGVDPRFASVLVRSFPRTLEQQEAAGVRERGLVGKRLEEEERGLNLSGIRMDMETEELQELVRLGGGKVKAAATIASLHNQEAMDKFQMQQLVEYGDFIDELALANPEASGLASLALTNQPFFQYIIEGRLAASAAEKGVTAPEILEIYLPLAQEIRMTTDQMMDAVDAGDDDALRTFATQLDILYRMQAEIMPDMPIIMTREKRKLFGGIRVITERLTPLTADERVETWAREATKRALDSVDAGADIGAELGLIESSEILQGMDEAGRAATMLKIRQWIEDVNSEDEPPSFFGGVAQERAEELSRLSSADLLKDFYAGRITRDEFYAARRIMTGRDKEPGVDTTISDAINSAIINATSGLFGAMQQLPRGGGG